MSTSSNGQFVEHGRDTRKEFVVSTEVYVSTAAGAGLRKHVPRKKSERFETTLGEDGKMKGKEESSSSERVVTAAGVWRPAICKLTEDGPRSLFNVYIDENTLYQTIYIHLINQTDIRAADSSIFFRRDCVGIYCLSSQMWRNPQAAEPVFLQFANSELCSTWLALLKSYAIPEIYGRWFYPDVGGSYRMWRQVELTALQGRNLGVTRPTDIVYETTNNGDSSPSEVVDLDISCEMHVNNFLCGRTTVKRGAGSPDWHEDFTFTDLPPFQNLDITVWRERKLSKPTMVGSVQIVLANFRRGEAVEGWFPVLHAGPIATDLQVGELRLKIRVDEEIILLQENYAQLLQLLNARNLMDWMTDFENFLRLKTIFTPLMSIAISQDSFITQIQEYTVREVDRAPSAQQTLFRGNSVLTKVMEMTMAWYGKAFLEASIGSVLRKLCAEKVAIEVDPERIGKNKDVRRSFEQLIFWCQEFWNQIFSVRQECPMEMRLLFETIRNLVENRYKNDNSSSNLNQDLPQQSVSAFCFLRFIVPAILNPHLFGLYPGLPSTSVKRSLTLIAKVIQSLANLNTTMQKELYMLGAKQFLQDSLPAMLEYIAVVSTSSVPTHSPHDISRLTRVGVTTSMQQRATRMPLLDCQSVPIPPCPDIPRNLAVISSAVIRYSKPFLSRARTGELGDRYMGEMCSICLDIEEKALKKVNELASKLSSERVQRSQGTRESLVMPLSTSSSGGHSQHGQKTRPSTAPRPFGNQESSLHSHDGQRPPAQHSKSSQIESDTPLVVNDGTQHSTLRTDPAVNADDTGKSSGIINALKLKRRFR